MQEWTWEASSTYPRSGGGAYPNDWTHLNDVEQIPDGRVMASLRNQDQVVFIHPETGLQPNWTLGAENNHSILYEQHNPDYIPPSRGGPAVIVADSHNNRLVEYHRINNSWRQTWQWTDTEMAWPRDADRLPNGNTLIVDSHGGRVLEVNQSGVIVWKIDGARSIYDAERLGTGDESQGGWSANSLNLTSRTTGTSNAETNDAVQTRQPSKLDKLKHVMKEMIPTKLIASVEFVLPNWMGFFDAIWLVIGVMSAAGWVGTELYWRFRIVHEGALQLPFQIERK